MSLVEVEMNPLELNCYIFLMVIVPFVYKVYIQDGFSLHYIVVCMQ